MDENTETKKPVTKTVKKKPTKKTTTKKATKKNEVATTEKPKHKGKGNPYAYKNSKLGDKNAITAKPGEISEIVSKCLEVYMWDPIDLDSDDEVEQRCAKYFEYCVQVDQRPCVEGLSVALGVSYQTVYDWQTGRKRGKNGPRRSEIIKKAKAVIAHVLAEMALGNKIYPNVWIFYGKNYFGMKDTQEVVLTPNNPLGESVNPEQIADNISQYDDDPIDV